MTNEQRKTVIQEGTSITGDLVSSGAVEINGYVQGEITAQDLEIGKTGKHYGNLRVDKASVAGLTKGAAKVKHLLSIAESGSVVGEVEYGRLELAMGGELSAAVRNVPPEISGDLDLAVAKGGTVRVTIRDLNALDPDDAPEDLVFKVSKAEHGFVTLASAPTAPAKSFTQADLAAGKVSFRHDDSASDKAGFVILVTDASGATSGAAKRVNVSVTQFR